MPRAGESREAFSFCEHGYYTTIGGGCKGWVGRVSVFTSPAPFRRRPSPSAHGGAGENRAAALTRGCQCTTYRHLSVLNPSIPQCSSTMPRAPNLQTQPPLHRNNRCRRRSILATKPGAQSGATHLQGALHLSCQLSQVPKYPANAFGRRRSASHLTTKARYWAATGKWARTNSPSTRVPSRSPTHSG